MLAGPLIISNNLKKCPDIITKYIIPNMYAIMKLTMNATR